MTKGPPSSDRGSSSPSCLGSFLDLRSPVTHPLGVQRGDVESGGQSKGSKSVPRESERSQRQKLIPKDQKFLQERASRERKPHVNRKSYKGGNSDRLY